MPPIKLSRGKTSLDEVSIVDKRPFIERQLDKLVLNVENSITAAGSSVLEVLERAPGVIISNGNSINLRGKSGVMIMIDGKITPLSGEELINYLKTIPATNIDKIKIITNHQPVTMLPATRALSISVLKKTSARALMAMFTLSDRQGGGTTNPITQPILT